MKRVAECRSCGASIVWVTTHKGNKMPLDLEPVAKGKWIFDGDPEDAKVVWIGEKDPYTGERFESHFGTCPKSQQWSKKSKSKAG